MLSLKKFLKDRLGINKPHLTSFNCAMDRYLKHGFSVNTVIDIGASDGKWCRNANKFLEDTTYFCIDPLEENEIGLKKCKAELPKFHYAICAAGGWDGTTTITVTDDLDGSTIGGTNGNISREIPVRSIDSLMDENELSGPYLMKFDTHGYEVPILNGAQKTLENTDVIIMEMYNFRLTEQTLLYHEMLSLLDTYGFRSFDIVDIGYRKYDNSFWQMDVFLCKKNHKIFEYSGYK